MYLCLYFVGLIQTGSKGNNYCYTTCN